MKCPKCGKSRPNVGVSFCVYCGVSLVAGAVFLRKSTAPPPPLTKPVLRTPASLARAPIAGSSQHTAAVGRSSPLSERWRVGVVAALCVGLVVIVAMGVSAKEAGRPRLDAVTPGTSTNSTGDTGGPSTDSGATKAKAPRAAPIGVMVYGTELAQAGFIAEERAMVPARTVVEEAGGSLNYDPATQTAYVVVGSTTATFTVGLQTAYVGQNAFSLEPPPRVMDGTVYVPLRFFATLLGAAVSYDANTRIAWIQSPGELSESGYTAPEEEGNPTLGFQPSIGPEDYPSAAAYAATCYSVSDLQAPYERSAADEWAWVHLWTPWLNLAFEIFNGSDEQGAQDVVDQYSGQLEFYVFVPQRDGYSESYSAALLQSSEAFYPFAEQAHDPSFRCSEDGVDWYWDRAVFWFETWELNPRGELLLEVTSSDGEVYVFIWDLGQIR